MLRGICNSVYNEWSHISKEVDESKTVETVIEKFSEIHRNIHPLGTNPTFFSPSLKFILKAAVFLGDFLPDPEDGFRCGFEKWLRASTKVEIQHLPPPVIIHIFSYLPPEDRLNAQKVCRLWNLYSLSSQSDVEVPQMSNDIIPMNHITKHFINTLDLVDFYVCTISSKMSNISSKVLNVTVFRVIDWFGLRHSIPSADSMLARNISSLQKKTLCAYLEQLDDDEEKILNTEEWFDQERSNHNVMIRVSVIAYTAYAAFAYLINPVLYSATHNDIGQVMIVHILLSPFTVLPVRTLMAIDCALNKARKTGKGRIKRLDQKVDAITKELQKNNSKDTRIQLNIAKCRFQKLHDHHKRVYDTDSVIVRYPGVAIIYGPSGPTSTFTQQYKTVKRTGYRDVKTSYYSIYQRKTIDSHRLESYSYSEIQPNGMKWECDVEGGKPFNFPISSSNKFITPKCEPEVEG